MSGIPGPGSRGEDVIRITPADANAPHVDDLLKRQASLRGEQGITANRRRKWYYRNWFVFMLAGALGAFAAWAIIEPRFNDLLYVQGPILDLDVTGNRVPPVELEPGEDARVADLEFTGRVRVGDDWIYLLSLTKPAGETGDQKPFDPQTLEVGQEVGLYVEIPEVPMGELFSAAAFVDPSPPPRAEPTAPVARLSAAQHAAAMLLFPLVAALAGFAIGAADGIVCRLWRRVLLAGAVGLLIGFIGGFVSQFLAGIVYRPLNELAMQQQAGGFGHLTPLGFVTQMTGRGLAWLLAGMAMGLGQGIALRSGRLLLYGFLGGAIGGLLGGLLFDPIDLIFVGGGQPSAHLARMVGLLIVGASVGLMIGVVELLARNAWLNMVKGPLAGKEFLIFKDLVRVGASPRSDIYLFNDPAVADHHATIRAAADHYEIETVNSMWPVLLNGRPVERARLRHGDQITLGETIFAFQTRRTG